MILHKIKSFYVSSLIILKAILSDFHGFSCLFTDFVSSLRRPLLRDRLDRKCLKPLPTPDLPNFRVHEFGHSFQSCGLDFAGP